MQYQHALVIAADRIERLGDNPEYERGMINLLADLYPIHEMDTGTRMEMIERDVAFLCRVGGPTMAYATELASVTAAVAARYPDDEQAQQAAEYAQQVEHDHA